MSLPWAEFISFWSNWFLVGALVIGVIATYGIVVSGNVKEAALKRDLATAGATAETARAEAAKANERAQQLRADNLALQAGIRPRRFSFMGWTVHPERVAAIYAQLKPYAGTIALIQVVPDFEAQMFARDIASVLVANGWKPQLVTEKESHMSDQSFPEGLFIFTLSDGKTKTEAGTALWTSMVDAFHEMGGQAFEGAPLHEILDRQKPGYPIIEPPITGVFIRVGLRQLSSQFLDIQRRELTQQDEEWDNKLIDFVKGGGKLMVPTTDGGVVEAKVGSNGKLISSDSTKKLVEPDRTPTLVMPNGMMLRSTPFPGQSK
jgi:hypothetical protein